MRFSLYLRFWTRQLQIQHGHKPFPFSFFEFFSGPLFAAVCFPPRDGGAWYLLVHGVSVGSQLFPSSIRSSALAFMFVLGQVGGCYCC